MKVNIGIVLLIIINIIVFIAWGIILALLQKRRKNEKLENIADADAHSLVDSADNSAELKEEAGEIKSDYRERIRDRFKQHLHGDSGAGTPADSGGGS